MHLRTVLLPPAWLLVALLLPARATADALMRIFTVQNEATGEVNFVGRNEGYCPYQIQVSFSALVNYVTTTPLPHHAVVPPDGRDHPLLTIRPRGPEQARYEARYLIELGDPAARPDTAWAYLFPFGHGQRYRVSQGYGGSYSHADKYALDFEMEAGTPVTAMRAGVVVDVKQDSDQGGPDASYQQAGNYVLVCHADGSLASYAHLRQNGVVKAVGDVVEAGELLAYSGNTGWTLGPHLHVEILRPVVMALRSMPTRFLAPAGPPVQPRTGRLYYGYHPGGAPFAVAEVLAPAGAAGYQAPVTQHDSVVVVKRTGDDGTMLVFIQNGTDGDKEATLHFELRNLDPTGPVPDRVRVPARTELFLFSATVGNPAQPAGYRLKMAVR